MVIIILVIGIILFVAAVSTSRIMLFDYSHHAFRLVASCFSISRIIKTTKKNTYSTLLPWFGIVEYVVLLILHFLLASVGDLQK